MGRVALILAIGSALAVNLFAVAGLVVAFESGHVTVSDNYVALLSGTLGVMIGALAAYIGGMNSCNCPCHRDHQEPEQ